MSKKPKKLNYFEVKRKIKRLEEFANSNESIELQLKSIKSLAEGFSIQANTKIQNDYMYRSRWNEDGYLFSHVDELKYKPAHLVKNKGRLNNIGESILYAAACKLGTILESKPITQKLFTICKIQCLDKELIYFPIGHKGGVKTSLGEKASDKLIYEYCTQQMQKVVNQPERYNATIAIGRFFLGTKLTGRRTGGEHCCLIYPSVESSKTVDIKTFNVGIPPDVFDKCFKIVEAKVYALTDESGSYMLNDLNCTTEIDRKGNMSWQYSLDEMAIRAFHGLRLDGTKNENIKNMVDRVSVQKPNTE